MVLKVTINLKPMKIKLATIPVLVMALLACPCLHSTAQSCTSTVGANTANTFSTMAYGGSGFSWNNPGNAQNSDGSYATAGTPLGIFSSAYSNYLVIQNFGFSIPSTATICEIVVDVQRYASGLIVGGSVSDKSVRLLQNGSLYGNDLAAGGGWPGSDGTATYGNATLASTWGGSWQPSDVNNTNFGVAISTDLTTLAAVTMQGKVNQVTVTVIYDPNSVLDITLGKFSAGLSPNGNGHLLTWTADAAAGSRFIIQRSGDSRNWQNIATVPGVPPAPHSSQAGGLLLVPYSYTDKDPLDGANYYRLQMVNAEGRSSYSAVCEVVKDNKISVRCWPNPCTNVINISSPQPVNRIVLKDAQGRIVYTQQAVTLSNVWQISTAGLPPGLYFVQVGSQTLRVLKTTN
jgi:hypothetical protein